MLWGEMPRKHSLIRLYSAPEVEQLKAWINFLNNKELKLGASMRYFLLSAAQQSTKGSERARGPWLGRWRVTPGDLQMQREMQRWLDQVWTEKRVGPTASAAIDDWLQTVPDTDRRAAGAGRITVTLKLDTARAQAMYAMLLLRDNPELVKRVGRCPWCRDYFFDGVIRTGPRAKFCKTQHRNSYYQYYNIHGKYRSEPPARA
jgi:hypothetical protein